MTGKRKERDSVDAPAEAPPPESQTPAAAAAAVGNRILAGYLAHEFLTKGTLLGQRFEPVKDPAPNPTQYGAYADVARLLKDDGAHVSGVLNPTDLGRWLQSPVARPADVAALRHKTRGGLSLDAWSSS